MGGFLIGGVFFALRRAVLPVLLLALSLSMAQAGAGLDVRYNDWELWTSAANAVLPARRGNVSPFRVNAGLGTVAAPEYLGSDEVSARILPLLDVNYAGTLFLSTQQGIGWNMWRKRTLRAGPRITFDFGRESGDSVNLTGLPDIDIGTEVGVFFEGFVSAWRFKGDFRKEVGGGHGGLLINGEVAWGSRWTKNISAIIGARTTYMDDSYAESYFTVSAANALATRPAYAATGGFRDVNGFVQFVYDFTQAFYVATELRGTALLQQAADSSITESDTFMTGSILAGVRF